MKKLIWNFIPSWALITLWEFIFFRKQITSTDTVGLIITAFILTVFYFIVIRIAFSTKAIHFVYWLLRTLHLRKKAKATFVKKGDMFILQFDKLDPGEEVKVEGEFLLSNGEMNRVDGTDKSKRIKVKKK